MGIIGLIVATSQKKTAAKKKITVQGPDMEHKL